MKPRRRLTSLPLLLLAVALAAAPAAADEWKTAPLFGADVRALAIHPDDPDLVLAGTSAGQVYRSRDGGVTWADAGPALPFAGWVVGALRFDPNRPGRVWAAIWGMWGSGHVAWSDDLGGYWVAAAGGLPDEPVYALEPVPGKEGWLYAGTLSGVWGTRDDGVTWRRLTGALPEIQKVTSLHVDPLRPETVLAGTWRRAYRSDDAGRSWRGVFEGMVLDSEVFSLTPVPGRPGELWATTCGWVYRTPDLGGTWQRFKEGLDERRTPSFAALPDGRLLAGTVGGLYQSADGGAAWRRITGPELSIHTVVYHPRRPERVLLGTEGSGVWVSVDGAATFRRAARGMTNLRVTSLAAGPGELLAAVNHAGPVSGIHRSTDGGRGFEPDFAPVPTVLDLAVQDGRAWAATERGLWERSGAEWRQVKELGDGRVEQVLAEPRAGGLVVARTADRLFERGETKWVEKRLEQGTPRSAAFHAGDLWVSDGALLHQLTGAGNHSTTTPSAGGKLAALGDRLLYWGPYGAWARAGEEALWVELPTKPSRVFSTGDPRFPALLVAGDKAYLYDRQRATLRKLPLSVPAQHLAAALVQEGRLILGTQGHGLLLGALPADPAEPAPEPPPVAGGGTSD